MIALNISVKNNYVGNCWRHVGNEIKKDPEVCKLAVSYHYSYLRDSSYLLKNDK